MEKYAHFNKYKKIGILFLILLLFPLYVEICNIMFHLGSLTGNITRQYVEGVCIK